MHRLRLDQWFSLAVGSDPLLGALWAALALLTVGLLALTQTRWGQSRSLHKCLVLSALVHLWLACYSFTIKVAPPESFMSGDPDGTVAVTSLDDRPISPTAPLAAPGDTPWERLGADLPAPASTDQVARAAAAPLEVSRQSLAASNLPGPARLATPSVGNALPEPAIPGVASSRPSATSTSPEPLAAPAAERRDSAGPIVALGEVPRTGGQRPGSELLLPGPIEPPAAASWLPPSPGTIAGEPTLPDLAMAFAALGGGGNPAPRGRPSAASPLDTAAPTGEAGADKPSVVRSVGGGGGGKSTGGAGGALNRLLDKAAPSDLPSQTLSAGPASELTSRAATGNATGKAAMEAIPEIYRLRTSPERAKLAERHGANAATEAAVKAALKWLASAQTADGRWSAAAFEGGRETKVDGRDRQGAGSHADSAMTGLALLALLAAGNTHAEGDYREPVTRGLNYLIATQGRDGNLAGSARTIEAMYSHAIASIALSEALGMTSDPQLRMPTRRAVAYTLSMQNATTGGWRYQAGDTGDTSQLGWQLMVLRSADLAGIAASENTLRGAARFLKSVSSGEQGGLACYRPGEKPTRTMTAEALYCWLVLGLAPDHPLAREASEHLMGQLPGDGQPNVYYWYYGTLALYQLQDARWTRWNDSLRTTLLRTQRTEGAFAGSWDPDPIWGSYGGRIYSTAISALCLEVYYRYLPLYRGMLARRPDAIPR